MIRGAAGGGGLQAEAYRAALEMQAKARRGIEDVAQQAAQGTQSPVGGITPSEPVGSGFAEALGDGLKAVDQSARAVDQLPMDMIEGRITEFHELAAQLKKSDLTVKFALEVRNKLIDAYREVMRMSV